MEGNVVSVEKVVHASPKVIFALIADPGRHRDIDGSGAVRRAKTEAAQRLALGSTFGMSMKVGIPYSTVNTVIEFEDDRRIAWQTRFPGMVGRFAAGRIWRYELEPVEGGTRVKESWDVSQDHQRLLLKLWGIPEMTRRNIEKTLERIEALTSSP